MKRSYLDYAMSVIVARALPDVRDGLKPVHRRILYSMHEQGHTPDKKYVKSARVVGDVMGKYHPHGDQAIYDALVRMAQDFSMRLPLIDGQGNFGSVDGDPPAAMRYTEAQMTTPPANCLRTSTRTRSTSRRTTTATSTSRWCCRQLPQSPLNGTLGDYRRHGDQHSAAHNLEVVRRRIMLIDNPGLSIDDLIGIVPGPDFPTGGIISAAPASAAPITSAAARS